MRDRDDRGLGDIGTGHRGVFQIDRADPLAAGFDDVLAPVGDPHKAVGIDRRDIAGMEPAIGLECGGGRLLILEIAADDPWTAHQQFADRFAVMRQRASLIVDDLHLDPKDRPPGLALDRHDRLGGGIAVLRLRHGGGAERAHLGHAPALDDADAVPVLERVDQGRRHRRAA